MPGAHWPEQAVVGRHHDGQHRVPPERGVVGQQDDRVAVRRHLHGPGDDALGVELGRPSAPPPAAGPPASAREPEPDPVGLRAATANTVAGQPRQRVGLEPLGVRARHDAERDRRARSRSSVAAPGPDVVTERRRPRTGVERRARARAGPAPSPRQLVAGACSRTHSGPRTPPATAR